MSQMRFGTAGGPSNLRYPQESWIHQQEIIAYREIESLKSVAQRALIRLSFVASILGGPSIHRATQAAFSEHAEAPALRRQ